MASASISLKASAMDSAATPRISITSTRSFFSLFVRCLAHQAPARRLPPLMIMGTGVESQGPHDEHDRSPIDLKRGGQFLDGFGVAAVHGAGDLVQVRADAV